MDAFKAIRQQARDKRDKALAAAHEVHSATLVRIAALEQDLNGREPPGQKTIASCVESVMPTDRQFTTIEIMSGLKALDPRRSWRKRSVDGHIYRMREKGLVRRLQRSKTHLPTIYVRADVEVELMPFGDKTLAVVVGEVLGGQKMSRTELVVTMLEAGYQTSMTPKALRDSVGVVLREGAYSEKGGKWAGA